MYPIDLLSEQEQKDIKDYLYHVNHKIAVHDSVLEHWNKAKIRLVRALGGKLRISFPCDIPLTRPERYAYYRQVFSTFEVFTDRGLRYYQETFFNKNFTDSIENEYVVEMLQTFFNYLMEYTNKHYIETTYTAPYDGEEKLMEDLYHFCHLFRYDTLNGMPSTLRSYDFYSIHFSVNPNSKPLRCIRKILAKVGYNKWDHFEKWSNQISDIHTQFSSYKGRLVISVHPIDYLTASDNSLGWNSCLSMTHDGGFSSGPLGLMNSDNTVIAYLESNMPYYYNDIEIPNKRWRVFVTMTKDFILVGNPYPYENSHISKAILDHLEKVVKDTVGWTYTYHKQQYKDMFSIWNVNNVDLDWVPASERRIYITAYGLYNDLIEANRQHEYYISRNPIMKSLKVNITGKTYCLKCGEPLTSYTYTEDSGGHEKVCEKCRREEMCDSCGRYRGDKDHNLYDVKLNGHDARLCHDCIDRLFYVPKLDTFATDYYYSRNYNSSWEENPPGFETLEAYLKKHIVKEGNEQRKISSSL